MKIKTKVEQYKRLLAIAEAGLFYGKDRFDEERYQELKSIALSLLSDGEKEIEEQLTFILEKNEGYPTPKVDVRAFIKQENKILLVEDHHTKEWALPGGFAEIGYSPKENIEKEVKEETGLTVRVDQLLAIFDTNARKDLPQAFQYYKVIFGCSVIEGSFVANNETSNSAFFALDDLPALSQKRTTEEQLTILANGILPYFD
nr:NUDIX hydrolase [Enterococcus sp. DIV1298c]